MTVVVDASLALRWVLQEDHSPDAVRLRVHWHETAQALIAPPIFRSEVTNAVHQQVRQSQLSHSVAFEAIELLIRSVSISEPAGLYSRALALARDLSLGSTYDALYVALAELEGCEVWTADRRLVRSTQARFPQVRWVGEKP